MSIEINESKPLLFLDLLPIYADLVQTTCNLKISLCWWKMWLGTRQKLIKSTNGSMVLIKLIDQLILYILCRINLTQYMVLYWQDNKITIWYVKFYTFSVKVVNYIEKSGQNKKMNCLFGPDRLPYNSINSQFDPLDISVK